MNIDDFFAPGGPLAGELPGYLPRDEQLRMAEAVARAIRRKRHLMVEAGTGVGKSFAYLAPAVLEAVPKGKRVVVSTHTISLQEQLIGQDIPVIQRATVEPFKAALAKGRGNYVAPRRLNIALRQARNNFDASDLVELERIADFVPNAVDGTRQEMIPEPSGGVFRRAQSESDNCLGSRCEFFENGCFYHNARRDLRTANLIVVNHALFFSDLRLRSEGSAILPDYDVCILDEAHSIEGIALQHFGVTLSQLAVDRLLARLDNPRTGGGFLKFLPKSERGIDLVNSTRRASRAFFGEVREFCGGSFQTKVIEDGDVNTRDLAGMLERVAAELEELRTRTSDPDLDAEVRAYAQRAMNQRDALLSISGHTESDYVQWAETRQGDRVELFRRPLDIASKLEDELFAQTETVILASATLSVGKGEAGLAPAAERLGLTGGDRLQVGSPFDYRRRVKLEVARSLGAPPGTGDPDYTARCAELVLGRIAACSGGAFILCTSYAFMRQLHELLVEDLQSEGRPVLLQGDGVPRDQMLRRFRESGRAVLFGTDSFWEGVDVKGDALSLVVIAKLPFPVPTQPMFRAREARLKEQGRNAFRELSLPEAALRLKQGFGRLVRTETDGGTVLVLDARLVTKPYGRALLAALPDVEVTSV